jgi:hypothetical protein
MEDEINGGPDTDTAGEMSIADSLRAAWDAAESAETTTETTTPDTDTAPSRDDGRDERGRFAAKQAAEAAAADPATAATAPAEPPAPAETPAIPAVEAPQHWAATDKELFGKLPPDGQKFLLDRHKAMEGDYTRRMQEIAPLRKAAEQWTPYLQQLGATPEQAFQSLIGAEYTLRTGTPEQKQQALRQLAEDYKITLGQPAQQPATDEYVDPQVAAVRQELAELKAWKTSRDQAEQQYRQQEEQRQQQTLQSTIDAFAAEKTEAGAPAHPHYEAVRATMGALISSGQAHDLKAAYDMAVYANPSIRQQLLTAQQDAAAKKSAEEAKAKALKATTAASSVSGSPVGSTAMPPAKSIREELERAWSGARA